MSSPDRIGPQGAIVISGASTGIGRAAALHLAGSGFTVFAGVRKDEDGRSLVADADGDLRPLRLDVTDAKEIKIAADEVADAVGEHGLVGLVNNAGVAYSGPLEFVGIDRLRSQLEVNLIGHVAMIQAFLPMLRARKGRILNVTSVGGRVASPFFGPYNASKFGLEAVTDCLRNELEPWDIKVIAIEPGSVATEIWNRGNEIASETIAEMPERGRRLYGSQIEALQKATKETGDRGIPAADVAKTMAEALTAKRPKARYLIGRDAKGMVLAQSLLPTGIYDRFIRRAMGLDSDS